MTRHYPSRQRYVPIDELLEQPLIRLLRALRHFGWVDIADLLDAMDVAPNERTGVAGRERNGVSVALRRCVRDGLIERRRSRRHTQTRTTSGRNVYDVRLTSAGRTFLSQRLDTPLPLASARELAVPLRPGTEAFLCE